MNIENEIERFILDELVEEPLDRIDPDESLISRGFLDSVAVLRLIAFLQERFEITVEDHELTLDNFETIQEMKAFLQRKMRPSLSRE